MLKLQGSFSTCIMFLDQVTRTLNQNENIAPFLLGKQLKVCLHQLRLKFGLEKSISLHRKINFILFPEA